MAPPKIPAGYLPEEHSPTPETGLPQCACHSWQRKAALVHGGPVNHKKNVFYVKDENFDLDKTIFTSVSGLMGARRMLMTARLANAPYWKPEEAASIDEKFNLFEEKLKIQKSPVPIYDHYADLMQFMETDCDFKTEHADGSFMDHLYFCRDYSKTYFHSESPRILFLHSIMGVGSNIFPMGVDKIDKLKSLLDDREFMHIAAFPSFLRMMTIGHLTHELMEKAESIKDGKTKIKSIDFHRVIDNEKMSFSGDDLMSALNIQLIHQLDFLPSTNWSTQIHDPLFQVFIEIYTLLKAMNKIDAKVDFSIDNVRDLSEKDDFGMPGSIGNTISKATPRWLKRNQMTKSVQNFSKAIGHNFKYTIQYE